MIHAPPSNRCSACLPISKILLQLQVARKKELEPLSYNKWTNNRPPAPVTYRHHTRVHPLHTTLSPSSNNKSTIQYLHYFQLFRENLANAFDLFHRRPTLISITASNSGFHFCYYFFSSCYCYSCSCRASDILAHHAPQWIEPLWCGKYNIHSLILIL